MSKKSDYNRGFLKNLRNRRRMRLGLRIVALLIVIGGATGLFVDYLSRLPRERFAKRYSYSRKVWLGAKNAAKAGYLALNSDADNAKYTSLPIVELYMKGKRLDKLNASLPESGRDYQTADLRIDGKSYKVDARFRGDSINHWAFPNKSWRIRFRKDKHYDNMRYMNLAVPRVDFQLSNWLGYELGRLMGGSLVPHAEMVHFRLNRKFDGVRLLLEQPDQDFLRRRNLEQGKIYIGDIDSSQIYGGVPRKRIYKDATGWELRTPSVETEPNEMAELVRLIAEEHNPYKFFYQMNDLVDMEALTKYKALLEIVGSVHVDDTHNGKFYFNPVNGKFIPIVWDTVAYLWKNTKPIDHGTNRLFRVMLSNPGFREEKDRHLWNSINGQLSSNAIKRLVLQKADDMRGDVYAFALKLHAKDSGIKHLTNDEWEESVQNLYRTVDERHGYIKDHLSKTDVAYSISRSDTDEKKNLVGIQVRSASGISLDHITLQLDPPVAGVEVNLERRGIEDIILPVNAELASLKGVSNDQGKVTFRVRDKLFSKRRYEPRKGAEIVPATYVYELTTEKPVAFASGVKVQAFNSISAEPYSIYHDPNMEVPQEHRKNIVWWDPDKFATRTIRKFSGEVEVKEDLILNQYEDLEIDPGTVITMAPGASILLLGGNLRMNGKTDEPIRIRGVEGAAPWGTIAVQGGEAQLRNVTISGGSEDRLGFVRYGGAFSVHNGKAGIYRSHFEGNYVSAKNADVAIRNSDFASIFDRMVFSSTSNVSQRGVRKIGGLPVHTAKLLSKEGHGTPIRTEREFKFSLVGKKISKMTLEEVAESVQEALERAVQQEQVWNAPQLVGNSYYSDPQVKDFVFRDVYFDTPDFLNYKHSLSYRLRNRYSSMSAYKYHVKRPFWSEFWPYRAEFQAKVNRKEVGGGFSTVEEARFEFRKESNPFSADRLPPPAPWDLGEFIPYFQQGEYRGLATYPAQEVMKFYREQGVETDEFVFEPSVVLITERFRQHLNIRSEWGSGPNPEQAYIISIDRSDVYDAGDYLQYLEDRKLGVKKKQGPGEIGEIVEIEVEFERNVSDVLDRRIAEAELAGNASDIERLTAVRDAFLADQQTIMQVIGDYFEEDQIEVLPANKSKYVQAFEFL